MSNTTSSGGNNIDPNSFTPDELVKHTYRLVLEMNSKMDEQKKEFASDKIHHNRKIEGLQHKVSVLETRMEERERNNKANLKIFSVGLAVLSAAMSLASYFIGQ